jgi:kynurenine formamidase
MSDLLKCLSEYTIIDLTHTLEEGMPRPQVPYGHIPWKSYERGDQFNTFMFLVFEHAGTHVDAPIHLGGVIGPSIDEISLNRWMGDCCVMDLTEKSENQLVTVNDIKKWESENGRIEKDQIVLLNYGWQRHWSTKRGVEVQPYLKNNPGLSKEAAIYLAEKNIKLVGSDTPTIDSDIDPNEPAHRVLLPKHVLILENAANLDKLPPRGSFFVGLPLKIKNGTGCPVRAVAFIPKR